MEASASIAKQMQKGHTEHQTSVGSFHTVVQKGKI
jgi:hypothetical protein